MNVAFSDFLFFSPIQSYPLLSTPIQSDFWGLIRLKTLGFHFSPFPISLFQNRRLSAPQSTLPSLDGNTTTNIQTIFSAGVVFLSKTHVKRRFRDANHSDANRSKRRRRSLNAQSFGTLRNRLAPGLELIRKLKGPLRQLILDAVKAAN